MPPKRPVVEATLSCPQPDNHLVEVTLKLPSSGSAGERTLVMPRWIPGSYKIRDFGRHVQDLKVQAGKKELPVRRTRTDGWTFRDPGTGTITVTYRSYCRDLTVDTSHVTDTHLYVHGVTTFVYDEHLRDLPWRVHVKVPKGWAIWTGLPQEGASGAWPDELAGSATFLAEHYDHLVDCPIEAGNHHHVERFRAAGKPHRVVVWNPPQNVDWQTVTHDLANLVEEAAAIFGGLPYKDYTFIAHVAKGHGGGLEHRNSTVLGVDPLSLTDRKQYETRWIPLCAHEFFHVWNVRRIQPDVFRPFDYQREVMTGLLWLFEGGTSYMEVPLMLRAKLGKADSAYETLAELVKYMEMAQGRHRVSVAEASRLTWTKLYQRHESNINTNVSYYSKGAAVCFCLDAHLREHGSNIDTVFRYLWEHHGRDDQPGVPEDGVAELIEKATGVNVKRQLTAWVDRPGELPLEKACKTLGLSFKRDHSDKDAKLGLGIMLDETQLKVTNVPDRWEGKPGPDAPAVPHPLDPDDEIVAIDGWKVTSKDLAKWVNRDPEAKEVGVTLFRDGRLRTVHVPLVEKLPDKVTIKEDKDAPAEAKRRRAAWKRSRVR